MPETVPQKKPFPLRPRHFLVFLFGLSLFAALLYLAFLKPPLPQITAIYPPEESNLADFTQIEINFKDALRPEQITVYSSPTLDLTLLADGRTLTIGLPETLEENTYSFTLSSLSQSITTLSYLYEPPPPPAQEKGDNDFFEALTALDPLAYPLLPYVPHETEKFYLNYDSPQTLIVKIKPGSTEKEVQKEVYAWIESLDFNPYEMEFNWVK